MLSNALLYCKFFFQHQSCELYRFLFRNSCGIHHLYSVPRGNMHGTHSGCWQSGEAVFPWYNLLIGILHIPTLLAVFWSSRSELCFRLRTVHQLLAGAGLIYVFVMIFLPMIFNTGICVAMLYSSHIYLKSWHI